MMRRMRDRFTAARRVVDRLAGASASSLVALAGAAVAFLVNILMARLLGPSARGEVAWILQGAYVLAPLIALGLDRESLRGILTRNHLSQSHIWIAAPFLSIAGYVVGGWRIVVLVLLASAGASLAIERGHAMASGAFRRYISLQFGFQAWTLLGALALYLTDVVSIQAWLGIYLLPAPFLFALWLAGALRSRRDGPAGRRPWTAVTRTSITHVPGTLGAIVAARGERLLLPVLASNSALGLYVVIATASESLLWFTQGLSDSRVSGLVSATITRRKVAKSALRDLAVFTVLAMILGVLIRFLLVPALGPSFSASDELVFPICFSAAMWATYRQVVSTWIASAQAAHTSVLELTGAAAVVCCSMVAIPRWGALGAAFGCAVAYAVMVLVAIGTVRLTMSKVSDNA